MTLDIQDLLNSILDGFSWIDYIRPESLPDIDLYVDQVIEFMEEEMHVSKRSPEDKVLTKTMVNNYVKNKLLPPPERKKYSKEHLLTLIFIYYFKNFLSMQDIRNVLNPVTDRYWGAGSDPSLEEIYTAVFSLEDAEVQSLKESIQASFLLSQEAIDAMEAMDEDDTDFLQKFVFICLLSFDVYVKKLLVQKIIDSMQPSGPKRED